MRSSSSRAGRGPESGQHSLVMVKSGPLAAVLESNREALIRQNMVEDGKIAGAGRTGSGRTVPGIEVRDRTADRGGNAGGSVKHVGQDQIRVAAVVARSGRWTDESLAQQPLDADSRGTPEQGARDWPWIRNGPGPSFSRTSSGRGIWPGRALVSSCRVGGGLGAVAASGVGRPAASIEQLVRPPADVQDAEAAMDQDEEAGPAPRASSRCAPGGCGA